MNFEEAAKSITPPPIYSCHRSLTEDKVGKQMIAYADTNGVTKLIFKNFAFNVEIRPVLRFAIFEE